ncbi:MAG: adenosine deaminase [Acidobacteriota bacterium]|nr:adenosine deaminase [Acidobacteriota bacterium]
MHASHSIITTLSRLVVTGVLLLIVVQAQESKLGSPEQRTARYLETIRKSPPQQLAFFLAMPKGADLHNHLSGSIYAESYIQWASDKGACVNTKTFVLAQAPCDSNPDMMPVKSAQTNSLIYRQMINAWSMRFWQYAGQNGHDQFFDAFGKFGVATYDQTGRMIADAASRAARGQVLYLELMLTPDGGLAGQIGQKVDWDGDFEGTLNKLKAAHIGEAVEAGIKNLRDAEHQKDKLLQCGTPQADPGCSVTIRYVAQVSRAAPLGTVFAQMVTGFTLANDPKSKVVAVNLVQGEDSLLSMQNFSVHMQMLRSLRPLYPRAHLSLHAGELSLGLVPPAGLSFHIRDSVQVAGAERIGHGVDIMHETEPYSLLKEMARRNILVEVCLSSNDLILGVSGKYHPLLTYLENGVPVALATDDEGVSRSEISREFLKAAEEQGLNYLQLKTLARNSLTYSFVDGQSLWSDARKFSAVSQCARDLGTMKPSSACQEFLSVNDKAQLQWNLEEQFEAFESKH